MQKNFQNVRFQPGTRSICFRTGLTVYEESFTDGALIPRGWSTAGYPNDLLEKCQTRLDPNRFIEPQAFRLEIDGRACDRGLEFVSFDQVESDKKTHAVTTLLEPERGIRIKVHTIIDGSPVFTRFLEIVNESDRAAAVSSLSVISGGIEEMDLSQGHSGLGKSELSDVSDFYELGYFDADGWGKEGDFSWHRLTPDLHSFCGRYQRDRYRHPVFFLRNKLKCTTMVGQLGWSGGYRFSFDYMAHKELDNTALAFDLAVDSFKPLIVLEPGETFISSEACVGLVSGGLDEAVNAMHEHVRRSVIPGGNKCLIGFGMGAEHDMNADTTLQYLEQAARSGAEVFIIDAGWYCPPGMENHWHPLAGNWDADPGRYPDGIGAIEKRCRELGMKFGFWMEVERIGPESRIFAGHRDWYAIRRNGSRIDGFLDFSKPEVVEWAISEASRVIEKYHLDLFRVDYNVSARDMFHANDGECRSIRHVEGVYRLYSELKKRFPEVIFENCAGGGGRTDLGIMRFFDHTWVSDRQIAPRSLEITNGMTMALPPDRVDRLVAGMGGHEIGSLAFQMRNAMFGHISINVFAPKDAAMNDEVFEFIKHSTDLYKNFIRPFIASAKIFHHTPDTNEIKRNGIVILELASEDQSRGVLGVFTLPGFGGQVINVRPRGLDISKNYRVTFDNSRRSVVIDGFRLVNDGLNIRQNGAFQSELVTFKAID